MSPQQPCLRSWRPLRERSCWIAPRQARRMVEDYCESVLLRVNVMLLM